MSDSSSTSPQFQDVSELMHSLLSNPDSLSKISKIIENYTSSASGDNSPPADNLDVQKETTNNTFKESKELSSNSSPTFQNSTKPENPFGMLSFLSSEKLQSLAFKDEQIALLLAIRPYLSEHRKELIDSFISFSKITKLLKNIS